MSVLGHSSSELSMKQIKTNQGHHAAPQHSFCCEIKVVVSNTIQEIHEYVLITEIVHKQQPDKRGSLRLKVPATYCYEAMLVYLYF